MRVNIDKLHPTQVSVGYQQVDDKRQKLRDMSEARQMRYLEEHPVPAIRGYNEKLYIVDHHHLCMAAMLNGIDKVYVKVLNDWSQLSYVDFWKKMYDGNYVWLYDNTGNPIAIDAFPQNLPASVRGLKDDPYRSLAGLVRKAGGYKKDETLFSEFKWANMLREHKVLEDEVKWDSALKMALKIIRG